MTATVERYNTREGLPLFAMGFRPFFLFGAIFAASAPPLWIIGYHGWIPGVTRDWHVHEMLFGYLGAVIAGFLLTAVPNWTGRRPLAGARLAALFGLWAGGRIVMLMAPHASLSTAIDGAFLFVLAIVIAREVIAGNNVRNLPICVLVLVLASANMLTHLRDAFPILAQLGERMALGVIAMLIALIGGRIAPNFTRSWMTKRAMQPEPALPGRLDSVALVTTAGALIGWVAAPDLLLSGALLMLAGALNAARLVQWKGWRVLSEPLVAILHTGFLWNTLALALLGSATLAPGVIPVIAGTHALTAGAFGVMTLAVMTRASRGHIGLPLIADGVTQVIFVIVNLGALLRVIAPLSPANNVVLIVASAILWSGAFALFAFAYGPLLAGASRQA